MDSSTSSVPGSGAVGSSEESWRTRRTSPSEMIGNASVPRGPSCSMGGSAGNGWSSARSGIHAGCRVRQTRPARPCPGPSRRSRNVAANSAPSSASVRKTPSTWSAPPSASGRQNMPIQHASALVRCSRTSGRATSIDGDPASARATCTWSRSRRVARLRSVTSSPMLVDPIRRPASSRRSVLFHAISRRSPDRVMMNISSCALIEPSRTWATKRSSAGLNVSAHGRPMSSAREYPARSARYWLQNVIRPSRSRLTAIRWTFSRSSRKRRSDCSRAPSRARRSACSCSFSSARPAVPPTVSRSSALSVSAGSWMSAATRFPDRSTMVTARPGRSAGSTGRPSASTYTCRSPSQ